MQHGPRFFMAAGPIIAGVAVLVYARMPAHLDYWVDLLPALLVFSVGLSLTVAPLTTTVLAEAGPGDAGIASGVNNAVARIAGLLAVAVLGIAAAGGTGHLTEHGFHVTMAAVAGLLICRRPDRRDRDPEPAATGDERGRRRRRTRAGSGRRRLARARRPPSAVPARRPEARRCPSTREGDPRARRSGTRGRDGSSAARRRAKRPLSTTCAVQSLMRQPAPPMRAAAIAASARAPTRIARRLGGSTPNASRPPSRRTRWISGSARSRSNQWKDEPATTASASPSASGISSAEPAMPSRPRALEDGAHPLVGLDGDNARRRAPRAHA